MAKRKAAKASNFVIRIKALPSDAMGLGGSPDGTQVYADGFGNIYAVRTEQVVYRLLGPSSQWPTSGPGVLDSERAGRRRKDA